MGFKIFRLTRAVVITWAFISSASAAISESGKTVVVDGIRYHVASDAVSVIGASADMLSRASTAGVDLIPLSIISDSSISFTASILQSTVDYYTKSDDVFNNGFLQSIYLKHTGPSPAAIQYPLDSVLGQYGTKLFMVSREYQSSVQGLEQPITDLQKDIPSGPYFMSAKTGNVYRAYRLYSDTYQAFTEGLKENGDGIYSVLNTAVDRSKTSTIGVPSRIYSTKTDAQPLAGIRLGVKDIYDIAGVKTGGGSRAYYGLYPEKNVTAITVQRLIDTGAVIVGKMVTTQFARGNDWVDYPASWNVRGDGYQDPIGSSTGPAAGIAGYDWLDITLGTDTGGSIRGPASLYGAFGNRPSFGLVSLEGVIPLSTNFDTPGFITRDPVLWHSAAKIFYFILLLFNVKRSLARVG
ncbi:hypothetical protein HYALB_00008278 [Hymenoscyphus albidus]|uniref:Amidase domain-containing protein n=1 Tax=Hymenoscyphus albidus TaxID=595503 RepID=A0A9N9LDA4_9HELO|nr:hypothetical protein HYALB_00008278 [Hymenoscyphus albidus]